MTIAEAREKCKTLAGRVPRDLLIVAILLLSCSASFGLGFLAGQGAGQGSPLSITQAPDLATFTDGQVVGSKGGAKYYLPWCSGAARISAANLVTFASAEAAREMGYTPAANCKGL